MKKVMILGALAALLALTGCNEKKEAANDVVSFDEVLTTRRSVRSYDASKKISEAEVRELLTATQEAPSCARLCMQHPLIPSISRVMHPSRCMHTSLLVFTPCI